jgi:hypothetical protein
MLRSCIDPPLVARLSRRGMVVDVRLFGVVLFLMLATVIVAVRDLRVIVRMGVPRCLVSNLAIIGNVVGDVPVVVLVSNCRMRVLWLPAFTLGSLSIGHSGSSFCPGPGLTSV